MQVRWTAEAANDLERIADYLLIHAPDRAPEMVRAVCDAPSTLLTFPNRGRPGKKAGTRELVLSTAISRRLRSARRRHLCRPQDLNRLALNPFEPTEQHRHHQVQRNHSRSLRQKPCERIFQALRDRQSYHLPLFDSGLRVS